MLQISETIKKVRAQNTKVKKNVERLMTELEAIKTQGKSRKKFDQIVKESRGGITQIKMFMTIIQNAGQTNIEDYITIMDDLRVDEEKLNALVEELENYLKGA